MDGSIAQPTLLDPCRVPNTVLARIDDRHHIRIFFPGLCSRQRQSSALTAEESSVLYNRGILPALREVAPTIIHHFPPTYRSETFRSTLRTGAQIQSTYPLNYGDVQPFSEALRRHMNRVEWGEDFVIGTEIKGIKNVSEHVPTANHAKNALYEVFRRFSNDGYNVEEGDWYVDVAVELLLKDKATVWRADSYRPIMMDLLEFSERETNSAVSNKWLFQLDLNQHLTQVAGFRATCPKPTGPYEVVYVQAYTTDKALTYQPEAENFGKTLRARHAMEGGGEGPSYTNHLLDSYVEARDTIDVAARLEVRVPLRHAAKVLLSVSREVYRQTALVFPRQLWW
jgi:hypothetical protein